MCLSNMSSKQVDGSYYENIGLSRIRVTLVVNDKLVKWMEFKLKIFKIGLATIIRFNIIAKDKYLRFSTLDLYYDWC